MFKHNLLCHPCSWARNEVNDHLRSPATESDLLNCQSIIPKQNLLLAQVFLYCSDTAQPSLSHCYFTQAMLQQWPFPLLPLPSPWPPHWHGMAWCGMVWYSGLLIGRPQNFLSFSSNPTKYRPQPQGNYSFQNSLSQNLRNCQNAAKVKPKLWFWFGQKRFLDFCQFAGNWGLLPTRCSSKW